jgi:hypothetical protein
MDSTERIDNNFTYHAPKGTQQARYAWIREKGKELAHLINMNCPHSPEKDHALHYLDMVVMNANASIARNENE